MHQRLQTCPIPPPCGKQGPPLGEIKEPWLGCLSGLQQVEDLPPQGSLFEAVQEDLVQNKPPYIPKDVFGL